MSQVIEGVILLEILGPCPFLFLISKPAINGLSKVMGTISQGLKPPILQGKINLSSL
jgi:hypothetical protein